MKNNKIPEGFKRVKIGEQIHFNCIEYTKDAGYSIVSNFGSNVIIQDNKRQVFKPVDESLDDIIRIIRGFPTYGVRYMPEGERLAYILWLAGAKTVKFTHRHWSGRKDPLSLMINPTSIIVTPYITPIFTNGRPLLWYLIDLYKKKVVGGGADPDKNYMQYCISCHGEYEKSNKKFCSEIVNYFNSLVDEFGTKELIKK